MDLGLTGKVAMVGGASRGLGFAVARVLLKEGAKVSIASSNLDSITAAAQQLQSEIDPSRADDVLPMQADLRAAGRSSAGSRATRAASAASICSS